MRELKIHLNQYSYNIIIANDLLAKTGEMIADVTNSNKLLLVSNPTVYSLYGGVVSQNLQKKGYKIITAIIPDGEEYKNIHEAMKVIDTAIENSIERSGVVVALGGGVVGDLAGFVAAIYQRGMDLVQIPTTLLSQVDSSVGGKVAVNHPQGKNIIGAFHQPKKVIIDIDTLKTLDGRQYKSGLVEALKYGIIYDEKFFTFLEDNTQKIKNMEHEILQEIIYWSCFIKKNIVEIDEKEQGIRAILNLGHTFGHSIEKLTHYKQYTHGEAVAIGILLATELSKTLSYVTNNEHNRIINLLKSLELIPLLPTLTMEEIYNGMLNDKKVENNKLKVILPKGIGDYIITDAIDKKQILDININ